MGKAAKEVFYQRILLKLSGEALSGDAGFGIDFSDKEVPIDHEQSVIELSDPDRFARD